jgi:hypothetical protein
MFPGIDAGGVAVVPQEAQGVAAYRLDAVHFESLLIHLKRRERLWGLFVAVAATAGAGALLAEVLQGVVAAMAVLPVDLDALGERDFDVLGLGGEGH